MQTLFSHIIRKRFSQVNEDVATDALAYVLESSDAVRQGMMKILRGVIPELPQLYFKTQVAEGSIRPDMWGFADTEPRVFVENKFWAGLTENQPVSYLEKLSVYSYPTVLLFIAPVARGHTLWREMNRRLSEAEISISEQEPTAGIPHIAKTGLGPLLALTSWTNILSILEHEAVEEPGTRGDLTQLRSLCDSADIDAFAPLSREELSDQHTPAFILQLNSIIQEATDLAISEGIISVDGLRPQASGERIGRYIRLPGNQGAGAWIGLHFALWKARGETPLWLLFSGTNFGRAQEVKALIEPWTTKKGVLTTTWEDNFVIALNLPAGEEKTKVVRSLVNDLREIGTIIEALPPSYSPEAEQES